MDEINDLKNKKKVVDQPALYRTAQTTIPVLAQIMTGVSLALIAISIDVTQNAVIDAININAKDMALIMFVISAFLFWMSTEACVKSQAWDYYFLPEEQRKILNLSDDKKYIVSCSEQSKWWYKVAVILYKIGSVSIFIGIIALLYPPNLTLLIMILVCLLSVAIIAILSKIKKEEFLR